MFQAMKFTSKVTLATSLLLVMILGVFTVNNFILMRSQTQTQLEAVLNAVSEAVSHNIAGWLNGKLQIVKSVAERHQADDSNEVMLRRMQDARVAGDFKNVYIGKAEKQFVLDDPSIQLPADYDPTIRPWYQLAAQKRDEGFTTPYIDATTNDLTITAVVPIVQNGNLIGVAGGDIEMATVAETVNEINFLGFGFAVLLDNEGRILSHPEKRFNDKPMADYFGKTLPMQKDFAEVTVGKEHKLVSFIPVTGIKNVQWYLAVVVNEDAVYAEVDAFRNIALLYMALGVLAVVVLMKFLLSYLLKPMAELNTAIKDIADGEGDLTRRLAIRGQDEFSELSQSFNRFVEKIHGSVSRVKRTTEQLDQSIQSLVKQTRSSQQVHDEQAKRTDSVATAINELSSSAVSISQNASHASSLASSASDVSAQSQQALTTNIAAIKHLAEQMQQAQQTMDSLETYTASIGQVLEVIRGVSEQTNLLALNAAIEAARAGDAGRGFAVVADEVRQLAQRTQQSTQQVQQTISQLQAGSASAVNVMKASIAESSSSVALAAQAGERMQQVNQAIGAIDDVNHAVAGATREQNSTIQSLDNDIHQISELAEQGQQHLQATLAECNRLQRQFEELEAMVATFRV
ncbi:MAG TPA: methyl-accepting chemotaxis protein [Rheinheimera sp.]|nr:methyl-accepting chemotaxis protein [Rheinheimera sp.]